MKPEKGTKAQTRIPHRSRSVGAGRGGVRGRDACDLGGHHLPSHCVSFCLPSSDGRETRREMQPQQHWTRRGEKMPKML